jgi:hypothetical protein
MYLCKRLLKLIERVPRFWFADSSAGRPFRALLGEVAGEDMALPQ